MRFRPQSMILPRTPKRSPEPWTTRARAPGRSLRTARHRLSWHYLRGEHLLLEVRLSTREHVEGFRMGPCASCRLLLPPPILHCGHRSGGMNAAPRRSGDCRDAYGDARDQTGELISQL